MTRTSRRRQCFPVSTAFRRRQLNWTSCYVLIIHMSSYTCIWRLITVSIWINVFSLPCNDVGRAGWLWFVWMYTPCRSWAVKYSDLRSDAHVRFECREPIRVKWIFTRSRTRGQRSSHADLWQSLTAVTHRLLITAHFSDPARMVAWVKLACA